MFLIEFQPVIFIRIVISTTGSGENIISNIINVILIIIKKKGSKNIPTKYCVTSIINSITNCLN